MKIYQVQNQFGIDALTLADQSVPTLGPGQVLLKMRAFSLNYRDLLVVKGLYNPKIPLPFTPFSDGVGEVASVGEGVEGIQTGDRVAGIFMQKWIDGEVNEEKAKSALGGGGPGMLAEYTVLNAEGVVPAPAHLSDEEAATLPCAAVTAWHALVAAGDVAPGDTVLTLGTGGVSLFALQFAKLMGARVLATSSSDEKLQRASQLGASAGINYKTTPDWDKKVRELTDGAGADHIVEVGGAGTLPKSLKCIRMGGHISLIGVLAGGGEFNPMPILMRKVRLQGIYVGSREMFLNMSRAIAMHHVRPVVDRVFSFGEVPEALRYMESARHFGKICVRID